MNQDTNYLNSLLKDLILDESSNKTSPIVRDTNLYNRKTNTNLPPNSYYQNNRKNESSNTKKTYTPSFSKDNDKQKLNNHSIYNYNMASHTPKTGFLPRDCLQSQNKYQEVNSNDRMLQFTMTPKNTPFPTVKPRDFQNSFQSSKRDKDNNDINQRFQKLSPLPKNIANNLNGNSNKINYEKITPMDTRIQYNFNNDN